MTAARPAWPAAPAAAALVASLAALVSLAAAVAPAVARAQTQDQSPAQTQDQTQDQVQGARWPGAATRPAATAPAPAPAAAPATAPSVADLARATALLDAGRGPEALVLARQQALAGSGPSAALAGYILERGLGGVPADLAGAIAAYRTGAGLGDVDCLAALGRLGAGGRGGIGPGETRGFLARAVAAGRTEYRTDLAVLLMDPAAGPPRPREAQTLLEAAARDGDAPGAHALAVLHDDGDPAIPDNPVTARALLVQAADGGIAAAQADLGLLLYQGRGGPRDLAGAVRLFALAARGGDRDGAFYYALMLARGEGIARNEAEALAWARTARGSSPDADRLAAALEARVAARP